MLRAILFVLIMAIGMGVGGSMAAYIFFGLLTLAGLVVVIESWKPLRWLVTRLSTFFDILIMIATIVATASLGVTITASLTVAGLGYTMIYAPYLRARHRRIKQQNK